MEEPRALHQAAGTNPRAVQVAALIASHRPMIFNIKPLATSLVVIAAICASMVGCASRDINPLTAGFEEVTYSQTSLSEPPASRVSLQYKNRAGKRVMIWPSLFGVRSVIKDDIAIFVGDQGYKAPPHNVRSTRPR